MAGVFEHCPYCGAKTPQKGRESTGAQAGTRCPACGNTFTPKIRGETQKEPVDEIPEADDRAVSALLAEGLRLAREKNHEAAVIKLRAASDKAPRRVDILMALGAACSRRNLAYEALCAYQRAAAIEPDNIEALFKAGALLVQQKRHERGMEFFRRILDIDPGNEQAALMIRIAGSAMERREASRAPSPAAKGETGLEKIFGLIKDARPTAWAASSFWIIIPAVFALLYAAWGREPGAARMILAAMLIYSVLLGVTVHELGHGLAAFLAGDDTALRAGRLTLNPASHLSLTGTLIVPALVYSLAGVIFGWARPVPFNPLKLARSPRDLALVSGAGPAASFAMSYVMFTLFLVVSAAHNSVYPEAALGFTVELSEPLNVGEGPFSPIWLAALELLAMGAVVNLILGVFNLLPIPPLDGGWLVKAAAPPSVALRLDRAGWIGILAIIAAVYLGFAVYLFYPAYIVITFYYLISAVIL